MERVVRQREKLAIRLEPQPGMGFRKLVNLLSGQLLCAEWSVKAEGDQRDAKRAADGMRAAAASRRRNPMKGQRDLLSQTVVRWRMNRLA